MTSIVRDPRLWPGTWEGWGGPEDRGRPGRQRRRLRKPDELEELPPPPPPPPEDDEEDEPPPPPPPPDELDDELELDAEDDEDEDADDEELDAVLDDEEEDELDVAELEEALDVVDELDDVGAVGLSPLVQALVSRPKPARATPPDSTRRKSRLSVRCRSSSAFGRRDSESCMRLTSCAER